MNVHEIKNEQWNKFNRMGEFVTGTQADYILTQHNLSKPNNKTILDIGVGDGTFIRTLSPSNTMIGADVSSDLLSGVKPYCKNTYLSEDIDKIEPVDLAICNLVIQHNHEYEVTRIINDVNIKNDGLFSFQFSSLNMQKTKLSPLIMGDINKSMLYFYSVEKMKSIVSRTNKRIIKEIGPIWFGEPFNFDWHIFHVVNK